MTIKHLQGRLDRLEPTSLDSMCIHPIEGESEMDLKRRIAAVGRPVFVAPRPAKTTEEWLERVERYLRGRNA